MSPDTLDTRSGYCSIMLADFMQRCESFVVFKLSVILLLIILEVMLRCRMYLLSFTKTSIVSIMIGNLVPLITLISIIADKPLAFITITISLIFVDVIQCFTPITTDTVLNWLNHCISHSLIIVRFILN